MLAKLSNVSTITIQFWMYAQFHFKMTSSCIKRSKTACIFYNLKTFVMLNFQISGSFSWQISSFCGWISCKWNSKFRWWQCLPPNICLQITNNVTTIRTNAVFFQTYNFGFELQQASAGIQIHSFMNTIQIHSFRLRILPKI